MASKFPWKTLTAGAATVVTADLALRPWFLHWDATKNEIKKTLPGDELCPDAASVATTGRAPDGAWAFVLEPIDDHTTRLLVRSRSGQAATPGRFLVFDPIHFIMERKMMLGIRKRAEAHGKAAARRTRLPTPG